jgi:hypothetical protein
LCDPGAHQAGPDHSNGVAHKPSSISGNAIRPVSLWTDAEQTVRVSLDGYSFLWAPALAFLAVLLLIGVLRWGFSSGGSLIARPPKKGPTGAYGLLVAVAEPTDAAAGERARSRLQDAGIRATLAQTDDGLRLMVFDGDLDRARRVLAH